MPLLPLVGHQEVRDRLADAVRSGRLPQVLLISGPSGVGKQRLALWLAQLVFCERRNAEPCGRCRACRLVEGLSHADLHWFAPIQRPKAADPDKAVEDAAQALAELIEERRNKPLYGPPDGMASHAMASVRLLHRQAALTSVEGGRRVFILGDAERLVPQESSQEAANALLKLLEEPPSGVLFVLTTVDPRRLLPTIRSRAVPIRLNRLNDEQVRSFLKEHLDPPLGAAALDERVAVAAGSIGEALGAGEETGKAYRAAGQLLEAVLAGSAAGYERALRQAPFSARGEFTAMLDALADTLGEAARGTLGQTTRRPVPAALLRRGDPAPLLRAIERVAEAREAAYGNVNPQILLAVLGEELAEVL
ncbi:MAG TPA: DNA polymerase III subunit [Gemmatimonadales bacterium]|nr:DNA polymerase III subunit [Gemmatimonadales bacterium]